MWFSLTIIEPPQLTLYCTGLGCCLTLFIQVFLFYIHAISHFLVYKSRCSFTLRCHPWCHLPTTQNKLPPVSLFFSAAFLQLCGPISLARQVPANLVSSFHSCKRIVTDSSRSRPPRPGSPSAGRRATWLPCEQPSTPSAGQPPSTPWQRRLI